MFTRTESQFSAVTMPKERSVSEMVDTLLKRIEPHMFSNKKGAIDSFSKQYFGAELMSEDDAYRLLIGAGIENLKKPGLLALAGHLRYKGDEVKLCRVSYKALAFVRKLMDEGSHRAADVMVKVFDSVEPAYYSLMRLDMHVKSTANEANPGNGLYFKKLIGESYSRDAPPKQTYADLQRINKSVWSSSSCMSTHSLPPLQEEQKASRQPQQTKSVGVRSSKKKSLNPNKTESALQLKKPGILAFLNNFFGSGRPDAKALQARGVLKIGRTFGQPLDRVVAEAGEDGVPNIVRTLCNAINSDEILNLVGLFRVSGESLQIQQLKKIYDYEDTPPDLSQFGPHTLTGTLKLYLRELPVPLFTYGIYGPMVDAYRARNFDEVEGLVARLPPNSLATWLCLKELFVATAARSEVNKMTAQNVAIVIAPNILRMEVETFIAIAKDTPVTCGAVECLVDRSSVDK